MSQTETDKPENVDGSLPKRLREAWMKTVGTYATDEKGTASLLQRLVDFGQISADEAKKVLAEARTKIEENKRELDKRVDESINESIKRTVGRFSEGKELKVIEDRVAELEARLKELEAH
jgi:polyhydroxyalkanoate synthesis regulator phasin